MHESVYLNSDSKKGAKQMQNRHLTEILPYMQNLLVPASNWSKSLFLVQKSIFDKSIFFGHLKNLISRFFRFLFSFLILINFEFLDKQWSLGTVWASQEILWNTNHISSTFVFGGKTEGSSDRKAFFSGLKKGVWETEIVWYREIPCSTKRRCKKRCWRQALSFLSDNPRHHHYKES